MARLAVTMSSSQMESRSTGMSPERPPIVRMTPALGGLREQTNFDCDFKVICPVQPSERKHSCSRATQITITTPAIPSREEGRWPSSRTLGRVAVDAAASGAWRFAGRLSVSELSATDERRLNAFANASAGKHLAGRCLWQRKLRTAKPCGPGARCWR
jgi:hypothetical protein